MLQTDIRGAGGPKRARTDGARGGEGDWTCPQCGNVNFAFRSTCNMRKCATPKPAESTQKGAAGAMGPTMYEQAPTPMYMGGPGAPPPLSLGLPSSYQPSMIIPQPAAVTVPYDYTASINNSISYNPRPSTYAPPGALIGARPSTYPPPGTVLTAGPIYGGTPVLDGYGMNMNMSMNMGIGPPMPAPRAPGNFGEENGSRKRRGGPDGFSEGDWVCPNCGNTNFAFRSTCNMRKCGASKPTEQARYGSGPPAPARAPPPVSQGPPPDGSWTCDACGNVNYPFRSKCNRRNCGADKPTEAKPAANTTSPPPAISQVCRVFVYESLYVKVKVLDQTLMLCCEYWWQLMVAIFCSCTLTSNLPSSKRYFLLCPSKSLMSICSLMYVLRLCLSDLGASGGKEGVGGKGLSLKVLICYFDVIKS